VSSLTSVFVVGLPAVAWNVQYLWDVTTLGLNLALVPFVVFLLPGVGWPWHPSPAQTWFLWLWAGPALLVYVLLHTGQAGYLLLLWPLVCYGAATAALVAGAELGRSWRRLWPVRPWRWSATPVLLSLLATSSTVLFLSAPFSGTLPVGLTRRTIVESDRFWGGLTDLVDTLSPEEVVVLTGTRSAESFRQATYYLPAFHVYAVGPDRQGELGVAFEGRRGRHTYADFMAGAPAAQRVSLGARTRRLLILDRSVTRLMESDGLEEVAVTPLRSVWMWPSEANAGALLQTLRLRRPLVAR
jgi:hypothetical protein